MGFLSGALFMWASDKIVSFARRKADSTEGKTNERLHRIMMLILSITLHNIPEGLAVGVAFGALGSGSCGTEDLMGAVSVAVGIGLQNFPEGAAVSVPLRSSGLICAFPCSIIGSTRVDWVEKKISLQTGFISSTDAISQP